jgi:hypothetical protein
MKQQTLTGRDIISKIYEELLGLGAFYIEGERDKKS